MAGGRPQCGQVPASTYAEVVHHKNVRGAHCAVYGVDSREEPWELQNIACTEAKRVPSIRRTYATGDSSEKVERLNWVRVSELGLPTHGVACQLR
jgi:hypothetical protein